MRIRFKRWNTAVALAFASAGGVAAQSGAAAESEVDANGIALRYAVHGPTHGEAVLLIGGTGMQLSDWPAPLIHGLAGGGHRVVVFDNRDAGLSTHLAHAGRPDWPAVFAALAAGDPPPIAYTLDDMAADAMALLDALSIGRAHLVGVSMGGNIAQLVAAEHPDRVRSLTSIMAGSGNPAIRIPAHPARLAAIPPPPPPADTTAAIERELALRRALAGRDVPVDEMRLREGVEASLARNYDPEGAERQGAAVVAAGDLRSRLRAIRAPTVVILGADDPVVSVEAGEDVARHIRGAELRVLPGIGHELPESSVPVVIELITGVVQRAHRSESGG